MKYQWLKNGLPLQGSFQNNLTITSTGTYQVESVDTTCMASERSIGVAINVRPLPEASISTQSVGIVYAPFKVLLKANQGTELSYQWMKQGTEIGRATASSLEVGESGSYSVRVTKFGCSRTSEPLEVTILQLLSVAAELEKEIKLYPNPNRGMFVVELPEDWKNAELVVYDSAGRRVGFRRVSSQLQIEGSGGSYWLRIEHQGKSTTKQFSVVP
ncbi:T9SS type A sorting domain-containing protein [Runella sp. MFBS21]|uniref:T9SS type A sorting domain-containing protein n=1 Tax=Runella sp. MFBS21 TaxID=3034018 RepID=UPI0023F7B7EE|nr:T9SS type A sorting domain-containing protein [Runella sp. MFBS21]MDF7817444.1 T9SS type A sorting domain-containing protein [Runella sp. MFBS21]